MSPRGVTDPDIARQDPLRTNFAFALTHRPPGGTVTRFEVGV